jgi:hypothetical protein
MNRCENQGKTAQIRCDNLALPGHIYCNSCRIANGGYNRYSPGYAHGNRSQTQHSSNKQE